MNRCFEKFCCIILRPKTKIILDLLPRSFANQNKYQNEMDTNIKSKIKRDGPKIITAEDARRFKYDMEINCNPKQLYNEEEFPQGPELCPLMKIGTRVRRGRHWQWKKQDASNQAEGTIIEELKSNGWIRVQWDNGLINSYRMGKDNKYDLQLTLPESTKPVKDINAEFEEDIEYASPDQFDSNIMDDVLKMYYDKLFPYNLFHEWLSYNSSMDFSFRELCFTMPDDKYLRYKSFYDVNGLMNALRSRCPRKIHVGAVFTDRPSDRMPGSKMVPRERELVFDVDSNSYNDIRNCCTGNRLCTKCWKLMAVAVKILERALRDDFGFKNILWVFSGRRGIHCWVCDAKARALNNEQRTDLLDYFNIGKKSLGTDEFCLHIQKSADICMKYFQSISVDQDLFMNTESRTKFLHKIKDVKTRVEVSRILPKCTTSLQAYHEIVNFFNKQSVKTEENKGGLSVLQNIIVDFLFPRLDHNVTINTNHLLKAPFSIHPDTGCVCVPFPSSDVDSFNSSNVPNLSELQDELYEYDRLNGKSCLPDYKKTSLHKYISHFEDFISSINEEK